MNRPQVFAAALVVAASLAGCSGGSPLFEPTGNVAYRFDGTYSWIDPVAIDGHGNVLDDHPLLGAARPAAVEQIVSGLATSPTGDNPASGAESSIGVTSSGALVVHGLDTLWRSDDHGKTWAVKHEFEGMFAPSMRDSWTTADPMLHVDPDTGRIFVLQMYPDTTCLYLATSDDEGETWSDDGDVAIAPGFGSCLIPYDDHPKIVTAPLGPDSPPGVTTNGYPNLVVVCANKVVPYGPVILGSWCMTSYDGGANFLHETQAIAPEEPCTGINGPPVVHPDGTLILPVGGLGGVASNCARPPAVAVSGDNGLTWQVRRMTTDHVNSGIDPDIAFTPDGTAYMVYTAQDSHTYLVRSSDKFQTWQGPWLLSPPGAVMDAFGAIVAGDDGRIAVAFLSSQSEQDDLARAVDSSEAKPGTMWHLIVASSIDASGAEPTFVVQTVTPVEDPVQVGCIWLRGGGSPTGCRNLLDFIDMGVLADGRYAVAFTDGCVPRNGCAGDPENSNFQSRDTTVAVAVQDRGASLFAANGDLPSLGLVVPPYPDPEAHAEPAGGA